MILRGYRGALHGREIVKREKTSKRELKNNNLLSLRR